MITFRSINVGASYQKMENKLFTGMIDVTMEAYVDDKLVKGVDHVEDLQKTFECMRLHQVCLYPAKYFRRPIGQIPELHIQPKRNSIQP